MKIRHELRVAGLIASTALALALFLSTAPTAQAQGQGQGMTLSGTIFGNLTPSGWAGHVIISFGNQAPVIGHFGDHLDSVKPGGKNGIDGTETITVSFDNGDSFKIVARFASNALTPGLLSFHETGAIAHGTGTFLNASGQVSIQGLVGGMPPFHEDAPPMWVASIQGVVVGVK